MAKTPAHAIKLLTDLAPAAIAKARGEAAQMQALIDKQGGGFKLAPWDWQYYAEQVRKAQYDARRVGDQAVLRARSRAARTASSSPRTSCTA